MSHAGRHRDRAPGTGDPPSTAALIEELRSVREEAARDMAEAARTIARLEAELHSAHLDPLTGALLRDAGGLALSVQIARARRGNGRFVLAFLDVDDMKSVNDRDGRAAGDTVLRTLVETIRSPCARSIPWFDSGGMSSSAPSAASRSRTRRSASGASRRRSSRPWGVSVGLAAWDGEETLDQLTARADAALLVAKRRAGKLRRVRFHAPARAAIAANVAREPHRERDVWHPAATDALREIIDSLDERAAFTRAIAAASRTLRERNRERLREARAVHDRVARHHATDPQEPP